MNARVQVYPGIFQTEPAPYTVGEINDAVALQLQQQTVGDLLGELEEVQDSLKAAIDTGDRELVGEMIFAVRQAYAERCADFQLFEQSWRQTTQEAAARVLLERAHRKQSERRFLAEPHDVSAFGELQG